eukprot:c9525_g1_i1.p1 GENE.c9525_g1_i1~~c9525_g1_i1.p1  ORF type:complete len:599 (+),score=142.03 c9525_g1_i1:29-1825(+)
MSLPNTASFADSYVSPFAPRQGKQLEWKNISYSVVNKKMKKQILNTVWGKVPGGKVCCILGPSGSGKTSLLNLLAGRISRTSRNEMSGEVTINDNAIEPVKYRRKIAYVMQDDALFPTLTPREALRFSAALRIPNSISKQQKESLVSSMIVELGLEKCADTLIGSALIKGVSGGERKRTSVGVELVTNPSLVFLDEPTSGLDSYSAHQCVDLLRKVGEAGSTVLCSIHQPSSDIFAMFDICILLRAGRIVYQGPVSGVVNHFGAAGFPVPINYNPADHIMDVVQRNTEQYLDEKKLMMTSPHPPILSVTSFGGAVDADPEIVISSNVITQLQWLVWREFVGTRRDVHSLVGRFLMTALLTILFGLIFRGAGSRDDSESDNLQAHFGALTMLGISSMFGTAQATLLQFPFERPIFLREYSTGTYKSVPYFISKILSEMPLAFVQNLLAIIVMYWLVEMQGSFILLVLVMWMLGIASTSVAMLLGSVFNDVKTAMEAAPALFVPQILFAGFFIRLELVPVYMRWAQYLCSLKYAMNLAILVEFNDCDPLEKMACSKLKDSNDIEKDHWWVYVLILLALFFGFRLLSLMVLRKRAKKFYSQ